MKQFFPTIHAATLSALLLCASHGASGAPCRSQTAADAGSTAGYTIDTKAAEATEDQDKSASDILGQCVGGITAVITIPVFPSLDDIFNQIKNEICRIASEKVHDAIYNVNAEIEAAMQSVPSGSGQAMAPMAKGPAKAESSSLPPTPQTSPKSDFWSRIWR